MRFIATCQSQGPSNRRTRFHFRTTPFTRCLQEVVILLTEVQVHSWFSGQNLNLLNCFCALSIMEILGPKCKQPEDKYILSQTRWLILAIRTRRHLLGAFCRSFPPQRWIRIPQTWLNDAFYAHLEVSLKKSAQSILTCKAVHQRLTNTKAISAFIRQPSLIEHLRLDRSIPRHVQKSLQPGSYSRLSKRLLSGPAAFISPLLVPTLGGWSVAAVPGTLHILT